jgi:PAS domain S-box-containing protein
MGARIRAFDWAATELGPPDRWPASLRTAVRILLTTNHPIFIFWGPNHTCFYNDAYSRSLGKERHPSMLGAHGREVWDEIWPIIGPQIAQVMAGRGATWHENQLVPTTRNGKLESVYWTYSYGPIDDEDAPNGVGGVLVICTETTAQVLAEQQLRAAEQRWRTLFDQAPGFVCVLGGADHRFEYANDRYLQLIGKRDIVGRTALEVIPEARDQLFIDLLDNVYRTGEAYVATAAPIWLNRSGTGPAELRYLDFVYQPVREVDGTISGIFVEGYDVTGRKRVETALAESERRLRIGLESARSGVFDWYVDTGELHWTDGHFALLGLEPGRQPPTYELWARHIHADDLERVTAAVSRSLETGERYSEEYRVLRADGTVRWVHGQGLLVREPGQPRRMVGALIDIHERKQVEAALRKSEERFRRMSNDVPSLVWMTDAHGGIEFINARCCEFFGTTLQQVQAHGWQRFVHPEDLERAREVVAKARANRTNFSLRIRMRHCSGEWRYMEPTGSPRITEAGEYHGHIGMCPDVTDLMTSQNVLFEADRRKDEFLATLSHELRNPLAPIRSAARILRAPDAEPQARVWASQVIDRQVHTMSALLDDLLDISRITHGTLTLSRQVVTLSTVVDAALEVARPVIEARRHRLLIDIPATPIEVEADPLRLSQALSNLLTNAAKYTDPGGQITLLGRTEGDALVISITDTGIGLARESLTQVFEMFSQVKTALDRSEGGLGIGLALVKGIVELHGGTIEARSDGPGKGCEFRLTLPAHATVRVAAQADCEPGAPGLRTSRRILVADDNRDGAQSLAMVLELAGHTVAVANGGRDALDRMRELRPEVALLDIGMPDMNGYAVASALRSEPWARDMVLIALTGWGGEEDKRRAFAAGFNHHMTKPVDLDLLEQLL